MTENTFKDTYYQLSFESHKTQQFATAQNGKGCGIIRGDTPIPPSTNNEWPNIRHIFEKECVKINLPGSKVFYLNIGRNF